MMKNQKGITLIALVITIIVLLILAGVSIAMLTGENGILNQATKSGDETKLAEQKEQVSLAINDLTSQYYEKKYVNDEDAVKNQKLGAYIVANLKTYKGLSEYVTFDEAGTTVTTKATNSEGKTESATYNTTDEKLGPWASTTTP